MPDDHQLRRRRTRRTVASRHNGSVPEYLQPGSVAAVRELAELIAAAEWAPPCYRGDDGHYLKEKIVLGIMHGAAVGLGPFAAVHAIAVIDGHPTIWGDGALALVERSGLIEDMREDYVADRRRRRYRDLHNAAAFMADADSPPLFHSHGGRSRAHAKGGPLANLSATHVDDAGALLGAARWLCRCLTRPVDPRRGRRLCCRRDAVARASANRISVSAIPAHRASRSSTPLRRLHGAPDE